MFRKILTAMLLLTCATGYSQTQFVATLSSPTSASDFGMDIIQTPDSGYAVLGTSITGTTSDIFLARLDKSGTTLWQKTFGGTGNDEGLAIAQLPWGGFIISAHTTSYGSGGDVLLIKTDANGDTLWTKAYGTNGNDLGKVIEVTPGGNYRITGVFFANTNKPGTLTVDSNGVYQSVQYVANQFASPDYRAHYLHGNRMGITGGGQMLIFTDTLGVYSGELNYGTSGKSIDACYIAGGYYAIAHWADYGGGNFNHGLMLTDTLGTKIWNIKFSTTDDDLPIWVKNDGHGGILMAVQNRNPNSYVSKMMLISCDLQGNIKWQKNYSLNGSSDHLMGNAIPTLDGGYALIGAKANGSFSSYITVLYKTDSLGVSGCDAFAGQMVVAATSDYTTTAATPFSFNLTNTGSRVTPASAASGLATTVRCSNVSTSVNEVNNISVAAYPNPVKDVLTLQSDKVLNGAYRIMSVGGQLVQQGEAGKTIEVSSLPTGLYFIQLTGTDYTATVRFVKE